MVWYGMVWYGMVFFTSFIFLQNRTYRSFYVASKEDPNLCNMIPSIPPTNLPRPCCRLRSSCTQQCAIQTATSRSCHAWREYSLNHLGLTMRRRDWNRAYFHQTESSTCGMVWRSVNAITFCRPMHPRVLTCSEDCWNPWRPRWLSTYSIEQEHQANSQLL